MAQITGRRFEGNFYFTPADYDFFAQSDDGVRAYIDNILIIDAWYDGYKQASNKFDRIGDGYHLMRVDYYERAGDGYVRVWWAYRGSSNPVQPSGNTSNDIPPPPPPPGPPLMAPTPECTYQLLIALSISLGRPCAALLSD
ncbi:MAG: hypothetical protein IPK16_23520 [Anaerolineales bacterium]|nr:hypothetical protein [Anaerolineales bacterium]